MRLIAVVVCSMKKHVSVISSLCIPTQIYHSIVLLVPVAMAYDMPIARIAEKCFCYSSVHPNRKVLLSIPELNTPIPQSVEALLHDSTDMRCL